MDVAAWLKNLGLGQYEAAFRDNAIEGDLLPTLTPDDLKDLGVSIVGHRRRLLDAIAALRAASQPPTDPRAALIPSATPLRPAPRSDDAERRPITVMFCDLVGSTSLAAKLDAEDWRKLVNTYLDESTKAVTEVGGHVLKRLGDGLMALFGYPRAQENDAERAVRAALAIQRGLMNINVRNSAEGEPELSARIGLESGPVVVEASGEVFGDAPNIAARVQVVADPGTVLITTNVQRQVAGLFVVEECGAHELKGVSKPVALYRVVRASGGRHFGARDLTPLVGREEELDLLRRRWEQAVRGEGQFVQIVGEPGIGKSRLVEEFRLGLGETRHTFVELSSSQLLQNTPLHPIAAWGRQRFGADEPDAQRLADLENTLRLIGLDPSEYAPLLAPLLDIPLSEERAAKLAPEELRRRQLAALVAWILAGARSQPAALVFEDLQWADPTSLDLLQALAERGRTAPLLIIATTRPEFHLPWSVRSHHSVISLGPLNRANVAQMVGEIAARLALSKELIEGVSDRTGGVPLFVEEVARLLLERGEAGGLQAIPPTLQQSLAARLDRLSEAREVAQIGAVLGRDFTYSLLSAVGEIDDLALQPALDVLADADVLIAAGSGHEANYRFKHALIQDAAYDSLLKSRRQALHRRAAEILAEQLGRIGAEPEIIAHHYTQAGLDDLAIEWWGKAGDQALRRSAFQEAVVHLGKAIAIADKTGGSSNRNEKAHDVVTPRREDLKSAEQMPGLAKAQALPLTREIGDAEKQRRRRLHLQTGYGQAMMWAKGFTADETQAAFSRVTELAIRTDDFSDRFAAGHIQWTFAFARGELRFARELQSRFLKEAEERGQTVEAGVALRGLALACYQAGDFLEAQTHCELALEACTLAYDRETQERFHDATGPIALSVLAVTMWQLGQLGRARELIDEAIRRAIELEHAPSMAHPLFWRSDLESLRRDADAASRAAEDLDRFGREQKTPFWQTNAELIAGWARGRIYDATAGAADMRQALAERAGQGLEASSWFSTVLLGELEAETLGAESALARVDEALTMAQQNEIRCNLAFPYLLRGELLLRCDSPNHVAALEAFQSAITIAQQQRARCWGLRGALALAKLYQSTARVAEAHDLLGPALEGFSSTSEMPEIEEAMSLLARLG